MALYLCSVRSPVGSVLFTKPVQASTVKGAADLMAAILLKEGVYGTMDVSHCSEGPGVMKVNHRGSFNLEQTACSRWLAVSAEKEPGDLSPEERSQILMKLLNSLQNATANVFMNDAAKIFADHKLIRSAS